MYLGKIYIIAAASGTGKTSLVKALVESLDDIAISVSHTTRPMRPGERQGQHYFFVNSEKFEQMIADEAFLEYAEVFDHCYGTTKQWVFDQINRGIDVILEIDWQGAQQIKKYFPQSISIFLLPPSLAELKKRLEKRNQDSLAVIAERATAAHLEISHCQEFDYIVINDNFDIALVDLRSIIRTHRLLKAAQLEKQKTLLKELLEFRKI